MPEAISSMNELIENMPQNEQLLASAKSSLLSQIESERYDEEDLLPLRNRKTFKSLVFPMLGLFGEWFRSVWGVVKVYLRSGLGLSGEWFKSVLLVFLPCLNRTGVVIWLTRLHDVIFTPPRRYCNGLRWCV